jgi:hypothetical protein
MKVLKISVKFAGQGVVNFGEGDGNHKQAKTVKVDGQKKVVISSACFKNALYGHSGLRHTSYVSHPHLQAALFASPNVILQGWMNPQENNIFKRKSPMTVLDLVQSNDATLENHIGTKMGAKTDKEEGKKGTTLRSEDTVGHIEYETTIYIDLQELQFLPLDGATDRLSLPEEIYKTDFFKSQWLKNIGESFPEISLYTKVSAEDNLPERGVLFSNDTVRKIVAHFIEKLKGFQLQRNKAFVAITGFEMVTQNGPLAKPVKINDISEITVTPNYVPADTDLEQRWAEVQEKFKESEKAAKRDAAENKKAKKTTKAVQPTE